MTRLSTSVHRFSVLQQTQTHSSCRFRYQDDLFLLCLQPGQHYRYH
ncbi:Uncharacterised protein [Vibrio cholerae]|nr:Uncharacterised protein [Vibrio cholerae]CSI56841.1 Uncharacterised protein [Vibrio cholerae]